MSAKAKSKPQHSTRHRKTRQIKPQAAKAAIVRRPTVAEAIERVLIQGDLSPLSPEQRLEYYRALCKSLGLNPLTKPFAYIALNGKLVLYALRDCTDQLRRIHGISVSKSTRQKEDDLCVVEVEVRNKDGRTDTGTGAWPVGTLNGEPLANAIMKAETKAKRRATLSICGLGFMDVSEIDTLVEGQDYNQVTPGGRIIETKALPNADVEGYLSRLSPEDRAKEEANLSRTRDDKVSKLTPAQQEVAARKVEQTAAKIGLHYIWYEASQTARINGPEALLKENREIFRPLWSQVEHAIIANAEQLEGLKYEFAKRGVPFVRGRESGV